MSWMLPASICILVAMCLLGAVFGYLYWTYRERYLKFWMFFSLASSLRYLALIAQVTLGKSPLLAVSYNLATVLGALLVVAGAQIFAYGRPLRWLPYPFLAGAAWGALAPYSQLSPPMIATPIFFLLGSALVYVGAVFLRHSPTRRRGSAVLTSALFILWGVHQYDYPILRFIEWFAPIGYAIGGTFALATSLGIILTYFERTREELLEREENFRALFEHAADSILLLEPAEVGPPIIRDVNQSTIDLYGFSRDELMGRPVTVLEVEPHSPEAAQERMTRLMAEGLLHFRVTHRAKDGTLRQLDVAAKLVRVAGRDMALSSERDVTELVSAQAERDRLNGELAHAQKMESVGRLAGGVAHDFNNMLGVIIGHAELAMNSLPPDSPAQDDLKEVHRAATRSADLTRQLLAFARKQAACPRPLDLNDAVAGALKMLRRLIGEGISLNWRPASLLWPVLMDPAQVDQLLANLVVNAQDAIKGVGTITIETSTEVLDRERCGLYPDALPGEYAVLIVRDDGCGMDAETLGKVFEPFYTTKELGKGTGLGLSTVYGIVRQNNGFVSVESAPGKGTAFFIHLPRHPAEVAPTDEGECAQAFPGGTETILLVEDETSLLAMNERILTGLGYTVLAALSPGEALQLMAENPGRADLLVTDVVMPQMNGRELAERLSESSPGLKTLYMSGYTANVIAEQGVIGEGVNFLQKPCSRAKLAAKVRQTLDN